MSETRHPKSADSPVSRSAPNAPAPGAAPVRAAGWGWLVAALGLCVLTVVAMRIEGRSWFCACGDARIYVGDVWSSHCSQHLLDPYSFTHFTHGLIFAGFFALLMPRMPRTWRFTGSIGLAAAWEILENSPLIINRYRTATMSLNYLGDSITNAMGDILCCAVGFMVATRLGWKWSIAVYLAIEVILLVTIRDNLALNVLMLLWPIDAVRQWQAPVQIPG